MSAFPGVDTEDGVVLVSKSKLRKDKNPMYKMGQLTVRTGVKIPIHGLMSG